MAYRQFRSLVQVAGDKLSAEEQKLLDLYYSVPSNSEIASAILGNASRALRSAINYVAVNGTDEFPAAKAATAT